MPISTKDFVAHELPMVAGLHYKDMNELGTVLEQINGA
jgi:hypothetical protein